MGMASSEWGLFMGALLLPPTLELKFNLLLSIVNYFCMVKAELNASRVLIYYSSSN